ncbi:hypothetical protein C6Y55_00670 [Stenotrophomonas maltophilia]|nr:hypothetical protein C6Y55_00670 [Stenotrophomonas maltophilia]
MSVFEFKARWKEELVCTGPHGSFVLELAMGRLTAYLSSEEAFRSSAPPCAADLWPQLRDELELWCETHQTALVVDPTARVY